MLQKLILACVCLLLLPSLALANALTIAPGAWGYDPDSPNREAAEALGCGTDPLFISISQDGTRYRGHRDENMAYHQADILDSGEKYLVLRYDGEKRMMGENETQIWTLLLVEDDMFVWIMGQPGDFRSGPSDPRYRCRDEMS
ncbi:MAG: hypothetical protein AAFP97_06870 [Pseudomonadota bacterium]